MTREEYIKFHREMCDKMVAITAKKNADYSGGSATDNAFANFTSVEALGFATTEQGFLTRMLDKFARISTFVKKGVLQVADESVEDTLLDLANYSILMAGYIKGKRQAQEAREEEFVSGLIDKTAGSGALNTKAEGMTLQNLNPDPRGLASNAFIRESP